jgi:hypothetical protein
MDAVMKDTITERMDAAMKDTIRVDTATDVVGSLNVEC